MARAPLVGKKKPEARIPVSGPAKVRAIPVFEPARLLTIEIDPARRANLGPVEGDFVRLVGPRGACEEARAKLLAAGAAAVKIEATPEEAAPSPEAPAAAPDEKIRAVAMAIVEASRFPEKDALRAEVDELLSGAGL